MTDSKYTKLVSDLQDVFQSGKTKDIEWRREQLMAMLQMVDDHGLDMADVLHKDLHKHKNEAYTMEIGYLRGELLNALNNLDEWTKPEYVKKNYMLGPFDTPIIYREPYGVVLVIGAWNYPIQLTLHVLVGVIVAGNCAVIKPSEISHHTAEFLEKLLPKYLDMDCFQVVNGGVPTTTALLQERWDYILFTGSSSIGKIVMQAACKHLTPVTLEMGGKSPCIVDSTNTNWDMVAKRILWGKFTNNGQTCIAPDYILVEEKVKQKLVEAILKHIKLFYGDNAQESESYGRIVQDRHHKRLVKVLHETKGTIYGGRFDESDLYIEPTFLVDVKPDDSAMQDELFGPILPIMSIANVEEAVKYIKKGEKPLAMYIFSKNQKTIDTIQARTSSGSICVNDTLMAGSINTLPFGGVGYSGLGGGYHGKFTYETFSHKKAFLHRATIDEPIMGMRYPPFTETKFNMMRRLTSQGKVKTRGFRRFLPFFLLTTVIAFIVKVFGVVRYLPDSVQNMLKMD